MRHLVICLTLLAAPAAAQTDPDRALCPTEEGYIDVTMAMLKALSPAREAGTLTEDEYTELSVNFAKMQNDLIDTADTAAFCHEILDMRVKYGF